MRNGFKAVLALVLSWNVVGTSTAWAQQDIIRAAAPKGAIEYIMVIELENESYQNTFGPNSPAVYLNNVLLPQGELIENYFATSHVSLGNYVSQVSGQQSTVAQNNDCLDFATLSNPPVKGDFTSVTPGIDSANPNYPGQVVGDGCVFPKPTANTHGAQTIGDQLDAVYPRSPRINWRGYAEDMGNILSRDYGTPAVGGGSYCAHPPFGIGTDNTNTAVPGDQYADRHNPFIYFHSVIDNVNRCNYHVVPLGTVTVGTNGNPDTFQGLLSSDLAQIGKAPRFMFVTPNLCNDGHDNPTCIGTNVEGTNVGGLVAADLWLKHWMPMILNSPAYQSGKMLVVITFDEAGVTDARACPNVDQTQCGSPTGPNNSNPGFSTLLGLFGVQQPPTMPYVYPGGGQVGAVLFNKDLIIPGTLNTTGYYNHYSALRSYEDLLGITSGYDDGYGHLGYASVPGLVPFGTDVFNAH
jgi:hypothetical protein